MRKNIYTQTVQEIKAPERAVNRMLETAGNSKNKEKIIYMKNIRKAVVAASLAAVLAVGGIFGISRMSSLKPEMSGAKTENSFVMTVNAAEINSSDYTVVNDLPYSRPANNESRANAGFNVDFMNVIQGEGIEDITYSINGGAFIITDEYAKKLIDGKKAIVNTAHKENTKLYSEITVPYINQPDGDRNINNEIAFLLGSDFRKDDVEGVVQKYEDACAKYSGTDFDDLNGAQIEEFRTKWENYCNFVLKNNEITVKVRFKDGKTEIKKLEFRTEANLDSNEANLQNSDGNAETRIIKTLTQSLKAKLA